MRTPALLSLALVLFAGSSANAAPIFYAAVSVTATDHFVGDSDFDSVLLNESDTAGELSAETSGSLAIGSVTDGVLHAYASGSAGYSANGSVSFFDTLLLTSDTLAAGTLVQLQASMDFSRTVTPNGVAVGSPCGGGAVAYAGIDTATSAFAAGSLLVQDHTCDLFDINNPTALINGIVGQELFVNAFLTAGTSGFEPNSADALNTFRFFLDPLGDFAYTTASGNTYFRETTQAPEPSTVALFGVGLLAGIGKLRRRRTAA